MWGTDMRGSTVYTVHSSVVEHFALNAECHGLESYPRRHFLLKNNWFVLLFFSSCTCNVHVRV